MAAHAVPEKTQRRPGLPKLLRQSLSAAQGVARTEVVGQATEVAPPTEVVGTATEVAPATEVVGNATEVAPPTEVVGTATEVDDVQVTKVSKARAPAGWSGTRAEYVAFRKAVVAFEAGKSYSSEKYPEMVKQAFDEVKNKMDAMATDSKKHTTQGIHALAGHQVELWKLGQQEAERRHQEQVAAINSMAQPMLPSTDAKTDALAGNLMIENGKSEAPESEDVKLGIDALADTGASGSSIQDLQAQVKAAKAAAKAKATAEKQAAAEKKRKREADKAAAKKQKLEEQLAALQK